jgi:hypothetical protein
VKRVTDKFVGIKVPCTLGDFIPRVLDYIVTVSFGYRLNCGYCKLYSGCFKLFCNAWVCVCVGVLVMCTCIYCFVLCVLCFLYCSFMYIFSYLYCLY